MSRRPRRWAKREMNPLSVLPTNGQKLNSFLRDRAYEADAPHLLRRARKPQLRKRNPQLCRPAERIDRGGDFPDRVPGIVGEVAVVAEHEVVLDAQRVHVEPEGAAVVVVAVEQHPEVVALSGRVAAPQ